MVDSWIYWSDSVGLYHAVCFGSLALLVAFVIWPEALGKSGRLGTASFLFLLCVFVVAARWPGLFYPRGFNPDEDQLVSAARALVLDPVFFRAAEAGSSGPLNVYPLLASLLAGTSPTLFSARLVGLGMICIALVALYFAGRAVFSESVSRFGAFLPGVFFGLTNYWDFTHYTSEHVPMALLAVGWALSAWAVFRSGLEFRSRVFFACLAACTFSMVPFAKLQATMAALGASVILVAGIFAYGRTWRERCSGAGIVCAAGVVIPLGLVGFFTANGAGEYFWTSYIQNALAYQGSGYRGISTLTMLGMILFAKPPLRPDDFLWFSGGWLALLCVGIFALIWTRKNFPSWPSWIFLSYTFILMFLAIWTVTSPQRNYPHYLVFLPAGMGIVAMALIGVVLAKLVYKPSAWRAFAVGLFLMLGVGPMIYARLQSPNSWAGLAQKWSSEKPGVIAAKILQASGGEGRLCVWGYNPTYYSETGLVQATRLSTSSALFNDNPLRPFFLGSYLEDLRRNRPKVFVDAVAPEQFVMMTKREEHGHEVVPEVRDFVASNYELFDEIDSVRIYRWREN